MKYKFTIFASMLFLSGNAIAAGYSTNSTSTSGLANSYAGSVTGVHDASDIFFNPAITAGVKKNQFIAAMTYIDLDIDPDNVKASSSGSAINGTEESNAGSDNFVPAFYLATPINDKTTFNLAVTSPFGLSSNYDSNWSGRYNAIKSKITTINFNPSVAYKISDEFSIGAGVVAQYYKATMTKTAATLAGDKLAMSKGSDWGYGYNFGAIYQPVKDFRMAFGYRSKIDHKIKGMANVDNLLSSDFDSKTTTPESLTLGFAYQLNKLVELAYDTTWTRWSRLKSLDLNAYQNQLLSSKTNFNFHDSFLHSVGANFSLSEKLILRTGLAYEKDAITNANRLPMIPTGDRIWTSFGASYSLKNGWSVDGAYSHQFYRAATMNVPESAVNPSLAAKYKTRVDVFSVAVKKDF